LDPVCGRHHKRKSILIWGETGVKGQTAEKGEGIRAGRGQSGNSKQKKKPVLTEASRRVTRGKSCELTSQQAEKAAGFQRQIVFNIWKEHPASCFVTSCRAGGGGGGSGGVWGGGGCGGGAQNHPAVYCYVSSPFKRRQKTRE